MLLLAEFGRPRNPDVLRIAEFGPPRNHDVLQLAENSRAPLFALGQGSTRHSWTCRSKFLVQLVAVVVCIPPVVADVRKMFRFLRKILTSKRGVLMTDAILTPAKSTEIPFSNVRKRV